MWEALRQTSSDNLPKEVTILQFGNREKMAADLGQLVLDKQKHATSSLLKMAAYYQRQPSQVGDCYVLLGSRRRCLAFLRVTKTATWAFGEIDDVFAKEEGDGSLENWLAIHTDYYQKQLAMLGETLQPTSQLHCEWFEVLKDLTLD